MSSNVGSGDAPPNTFYDELFGEEESDYEPTDSDATDDEVEITDLDEDCSESPDPLLFSPLPSSTRRLAESRERSRSPIRLRPHVDPEPSTSYVPGDIVWIHKHEDDAVPSSFKAPPEESESQSFCSPDAHYLFKVYDDGRAGDECSGDGRIRGRDARRGGRKGRGRGRARACGVSGRGRGVGRPRQGWTIGNPITEVYLTDDDVPSNVREQVMEIVRKRELRAQEERKIMERKRGRNMDVDEDELDEYFDADDGALLGGDGNHFEWRSMADFKGQEEVFLPTRTGSLESFTEGYQAFRSYWTDDILQHIAAQTNKYASKIRSESFQAEWHDTNPDEILCLFAFWMMLGIVRMPTINSCFSTNALLKTDVFRNIFTRRRYDSLSRALNFVHASVPSNSANWTSTDNPAALDQLYCLRPILRHLNERFQANFIPGKDICIDESLTLWKGKLSIKQYIKSKAAKFGIKSFELCDSATGYLWSFLIYTGKQPTTDVLRTNVSKTTAIVLSLIEPLLYKGYRLFMDRWFNSPLLARFLKRNGTDCVGTLVTNRANVPPIVRLAPLKQGELIARHSGDICVLSWQDRNRVDMISTCHGSSTALATVPSGTPNRPLQYKPQAMLDYNRSMGGVDMKDQMLEPYLLERKRCAKWYMKLFKRLLNCSILNSRILLESSTKSKQDHFLFRLNLVDDILKRHLSRCPLSRKHSRSTSHALPHNMPPHAHWLISIERSPANVARNRKARRRCVVCLREGRKTSKSCYQCETCRVPLCVEGCFKIYHTS